MRSVSSTDSIAMSHDLAQPPRSPQRDDGRSSLSCRPLIRQKERTFCVGFTRSIRTSSFAEFERAAPTRRVRHPPRPARALRFEALLEKGETIASRYANASLKEDRDQLPEHLRKLFEEPKLAAAFKAADDMDVGDRRGTVERGRLGWERLKGLMESDMLPDDPQGEALIGSFRLSQRI